MCRLRHIRRLVGALTAALVTVLIAAPTAEAQLVDRSHEHVVDTFEGDVCGIHVVSHVDFVFNQQQRLGKNGFPLFKGTASGVQTFTNPDTGVTLWLRFAGLGFKDLRVVDNGDGTITVYTATIGLPEKLYAPDGSVVSRDAGRAVFSTTLDYNGTPADASDDIFISGQDEFTRGPHPDLESDFGIFCDWITTYLG